MTDKNAHIQRRNGKEFHVPGTVELGKLKITVLTRGMEQSNQECLDGRDNRTQEMGDSMEHII